MDERPDLTDDQRRVAAFLAEHDIDAPPAYRLLDVVSEVGEVAKDAAESTDYGTDPDAIDVSEDELGDAVFALLALADALDIDASAALTASLEKYETRLAERSDPSSGE